MGEHLVDAVLAVLLLTTTLFCGLVHRRLQRLRTDRGEMAAFVLALDEAVTRAEGALKSLRETTSELDRTLHEQATLAQRHVNDLSRLVEGGGQLAKRLEAAVHQGARTMAEHNLPRDRVKMAAREPPPPEPASPARPGLGGLRRALETGLAGMPGVAR